MTGKKKALKVYVKPSIIVVEMEEEPLLAGSGESSSGGGYSDNTGEPDNAGDPDNTGDPEAKRNVLPYDDMAW